MDNDSFGFIDYVTNNWQQLAIALIIGIIIGYIVPKWAREKKIKLKNLDTLVIIISFLVAVLCLFSSTAVSNSVVYTGILSFYSSFVFSWQLTKKSSIEDFKLRQHEIAKNTHRHIQDIETAALVTKERLSDILKQEKIEKKDIEGLQDDIVIILTGIRTNEGDWEDMMDEEYLKKLKGKDDPEAKLKKVKSVNQPNINDLKKVGSTVPEAKQNDEIDEETKKSV